MCFFFFFGVVRMIRKEERKTIRRQHNRWYKECRVVSLWDNRKRNSKDLLLVQIPFRSSSSSPPRKKKKIVSFPFPSSSLVSSKIPVFNLVSIDIVRPVSIIAQTTNSGSSSFLRSKSKSMKWTYKELG